MRTIRVPFAVDRPAPGQTVVHSIDLPFNPAILLVVAMAFAFVALMWIA